MRYNTVVGLARVVHPLSERLGSVVFTGSEPQTPPPRSAPLPKPPAKSYQFPSFFPFFHIPSSSDSPLPFKAIWSPTPTFLFSPCTPPLIQPKFSTLRYVDNDDDVVVFNLCWEGDGDIGSRLRKVHEDLRAILIGGHRMKYFHLFLMDGNHAKRFVNLIIEDCLENSDGSTMQFAITFKILKEDGYFFAYRIGRGNPDVNDPDNSEPWRLGSGMEERRIMTDFIPGAVDGRFGVEYGGISEDQTVGWNILHESLVLMYELRNRNSYREIRRIEKCFHVVCQHMIEPVRITRLSEYLVKLFDKGQDEELKRIYIMYIKKWRKFSVSLGHDFHGEAEFKEIAEFGVTIGKEDVLMDLGLLAAINVNKERETLEAREGKKKTEEKEKLEKFRS